MQLVNRATGSRRRRALQIRRRPREVPLDYVAGEFDKDEFPEKFTLGDGKMYGGYHNRPLETDGEYDVYLGSISRISSTVEYHLWFGVTLNN